MFHWLYVRKPVKGSKKGAPTAIAVRVDFGRYALFGEAECHPLDNFDRRIGRRLALTRAIEELPRETRKEIWQEYWRLNPTMVPR